MAEMVNGVNPQPQQPHGIAAVKHDTQLAGGLMGAAQTNLAGLNSQDASVFTGQDVVQELQTKYGFDNQTAQAINDILDVDGSGQASAEEHEAIMNALKERQVDADNNGEINGIEVLTYLNNTSDEDLKALDEELVSSLSADDKVEEEAAAEEAEQEAPEELDINQILESGDLSSLSQMGTDLQTGKYGVEGLTTASQIMREVFGMDYYSDEGQAVWNKLVEINQNYGDTAITTQKDSEGSPIVLAYQNIYLSVPQPEVQEESAEQSQENAAIDNMYNTSIEGTV